MVRAKLLATVLLIATLAAVSGRETNPDFPPPGGFGRPAGLHFAPGMGEPLAIARLEGAGQSGDARWALLTERAILIVDGRSNVLATLARPRAAWPARLVVTRVGPDWLIAAVQGRPASIFDRLRFRRPWRSAPVSVGGSAVLYRFDSGDNSLEKVWDGPGPDVNPWWVGFGDFTGAGRPSLLIGVWKEARFDPVYDRRPFVYGLYGPDTDPATGDAPAPFPQWLGSRLSSPFLDLAAGDADADGIDEICAVTTTPGDTYDVSVYEWDGFGVVLESRVSGFERVRALSVVSPGLIAVVGRLGDGLDGGQGDGLDGRGLTGGGARDRLFLFSHPRGSIGFSRIESIPLPLTWDRPGRLTLTGSAGGDLAVEASGHVVVGPPVAP